MTERKWFDVMYGRKQRMARLIRIDAPDAIICNEARNILVADAHWKWLAIARWIWTDAAVFWKGVWFDLKVQRLMFAGWPEACAIGICTGELRKTHSKKGCKCAEKFEDEVVAALRREGDA